MGPGALAHVLRELKQPVDPKLLVGIDTADDAGVYQMSPTMALVQTVDFFTPIVDDPYTFGEIAAANSLSDIYAMGASPLTVMNIAAFPVCTLGPEVLREILRGGLAKVTEAGAVMLGGHTVDDPEPKYGLSVTGVVHPDRIWTNRGAKPGDALVLTKPVGTGVLATAARASLFISGAAAAAESMTMLNKTAAAIAQRFSVHACTDITGFGLLGHAYEMAAASGVQLYVTSQNIPFFPEALPAAAMGLVPAGAYANRDYVPAVSFASGIQENIRDLCYDPQTSGGLLFAVPENEAEELRAALYSGGIRHAAIIGRVGPSGKGEIHVI